MAEADDRRDDEEKEEEREPKGSGGLEEEDEEPLEVLEERCVEELRGEEEAWKDATAGKSDAAMEQLCATAMRAARDALLQARALDEQLATERAEAEAGLAERDAAVASQRAALAELIRTTGSQSVDAHGRSLPPAMLEQHMHQAAELDAALETERTKAIRLRSTLRGVEANVRRREEARDGLHVIDFEQLKIENQAFAEKIETRNEELAKLRCKIDATVQVVTHIKEKLLFVHGETEALRASLTDAEARVLAARDGLSMSKQQRDTLRAANVRLQQQNGLIGSADLLQDYETNRVALDEARARLDHLRRAHASLAGTIPSTATPPPPTTDSSSGGGGSSTGAGTGTGVKLPAIIPPSSR